VNVEVDVLGKYVARLLSLGTSEPRNPGTSEPQHSRIPEPLPK